MKNILFILATILYTSVAFSQFDSVYTSVSSEDCLTISVSNATDEIDFYSGECPSLGGYQVLVVGGDIRYNLDLKYNGVRIPTYKPGAFHDMGSTVIEWRYSKMGDGYQSQVNYTALIYRLSLDTYTEEQGQVEKDTLVVVRLAQENSCVIGLVEQQANMNEKAQAIADDMSRTCLLSPSIY